MAEFVVPLESNPEVLNKYLEKVGVSNSYQLVDVYGLEDDVLNFTPKPVNALILLFPVSEIYETHRKKEDEALSGNPPAIPENLFFMRQYVRNSCGTMALIHSIFNNLQTIELKDGSVIKMFYDKAKVMTPEERGKLLVQDKEFIDVHQNLAQEGQTAAPPSDSKVEHHFISFVNVGGELFELDGSKNFPISHGATKEETFLNDAARVCKDFIARDPEGNYGIMALACAKSI